MMSDRRRIDAPAGGTWAPVFAQLANSENLVHFPTRTRGPFELRKICECKPPEPILCDSSADV